MRSSPRTSASTTLPSSVVTGIAFDVAATSIERNSPSASQVLTFGVSTSAGDASGSGNTGARGMPRATSRSAAKSPFSHVTSVFSPAPAGARKSTEPLPPIIPDSASTSNAFSPQRSKMRSYARALQLEVLRQPRLVTVERVGVLHDELAQPDQPGARPRLVAFLDREVVEHLRQLPVALQLARVEGDRLLVRQRQHVVGALAILEAEELLDVVAPGLLPQLVRRQHRHQHLLAADRVHLLADDLLDLAVHSPAERQERPDAAGHLPDEAATDEQLVVDGLGVCRRVTQGRQKQV